MSYIISSSLAIFFLLIVPSAILQQKSFNDYERIRWLHDFVRRGKGYVSKLPFDEIFIDQLQSDTIRTSTAVNRLTEIAETDANVVKIGGYFNMTTDSTAKIVPIFPAIINTKSRGFLSTTTMPSSRTTIATFISQLTTTVASKYFRQLGNDNGKTRFDFNRLASILQKIIDKRKAKKTSFVKENEPKQTVSIKNDSISKEIVRSSAQQSAFSVADLKPTKIIYHRVNSDWKPENNDAIFRSFEIEDTKKMHGNDNLLGENQALKSNNRYPHDILASIRIIKSKKENNNMVLSETTLPMSEIHINENPMIYIIREGSVVQNSDKVYGFVSSITLVIDNGEKILVDSGLSTDINERTWIMQRLSDLGAPPPSIGHVVTTHGHPDHAGNTNHFPDAIHYAGRFMHVGTYPYFSRILEDDVEKLTKNVYLLKTPGHTSDDISVLINNASFFGTVIVSGDIFIRKEDMKDSTIWKQLTANETQQEESRRRSLCLADCIIPGHGPLFRVTSNMKRMLNCQGSY